MAETAGRFSPEFMEVREKVGSALHDALHPHHSWSGCSNPDLVYEQMNRLADHLIDIPGAAEAWVAFGEEYDRREVPA